MVDEESPFDEELNDSTMLKSKDAILMVYLASLAGTEKLEIILAEFLQAWRYQSAPFPTAEIGNLFLAIVCVVVVSAAVHIRLSGLQDRVNDDRQFPSYSNHGTRTANANRPD